jgi:hypothetical protein
MDLEYILNQLLAGLLVLPAPAAVGAEIVRT